MKDIILLLAGAIIGVLFSEVWKLLKLDKYSEQIIHKFSVKPIPRERLFQSFMLGLRDTHICIIDGDGESTFAPEEIICRFEDKDFDIPALLADEVKMIEAAEKAKESKSQPFAWNGKMAHITSFTPTRTSNTEENRLLINLCRTQYYHFLAANVTIYNEFKKHGFDSPARQRLVGEFSEWRTRVPPHMANGLPINLFVLTNDIPRKLVFSIRSASVAIAPNEISCAVNENIHPEHDRIGDGKKLDVLTLIRRALREELGWIDDPQSGKISQTSILGFAVSTGDVGYGLFGYTQLPIAYSELQLMYSMAARDRYETTSLIGIPFDIKTICSFIHRQNLYNYIGVAAYYTMIHEGKNIAKIDREFMKLQ